MNYVQPSMSRGGISNLHLPKEDTTQLSPEQRLWAAVLKDAIEILDLPPRNPRALLRRNEVFAWIHSPNIHIGSFLWIVGVLKLDDDYVQRLIKERARS